MCGTKSGSVPETCAAMRLDHRQIDRADLQAARSRGIDIFQEMLFARLELRIAARIFGPGLRRLNGRALAPGAAENSPGGTAEGREIHRAPLAKTGTKSRRCARPRSRCSRKARRPPPRVPRSAIHDE